MSQLQLPKYAVPTDGINEEVMKKHIREFLGGEARFWKEIVRVARVRIKSLLTAVAGGEAGVSCASTNLFHHGTAYKDTWKKTLLIQSCDRSSFMTSRNGVSLTHHEPLPLQRASLVNHKRSHPLRALQEILGGNDQTLKAQRQVYP